MPGIKRMSVVSLITYLGIFVFAITGALKARTHKMDVFGASVLAFTSAYGGGTIRDVIIGISPVSWLYDTLALCLVFAALLMVYLLKSNIGKSRKSIIIMDAIGLGMFTIAGIEICLEKEISTAYSIILGVISATFGGLITDVLCNNKPDLLRNGEIYATACFLGGILFVFLNKTDLTKSLNLTICVLFIVLFRIITKINKIYMPHI